jgi:hypothetical protein
MARVDVRKTYKLYIGGAFPRSESGHSYVVEDSKGKFVANAALASRKDARDAVVAARGAFKGWSGRTAYNRAQILYRVAEVMEDRRPQFVEAVRQSEGLTAARANAAVDEAIDRLVWYAGWADKLTQVVVGDRAEHLPEGARAAEPCLLEVPRVGHAGGRAPGVHLEVAVDVLRRVGPDPVEQQREARARELVGDAVREPRIRDDPGVGDRVPGAAHRHPQLHHCPVGVPHHVLGAGHGGRQLQDRAGVLLGVGAEPERCRLLGRDQRVHLGDMRAGGRLEGEPGGKPRGKQDGHGSSVTPESGGGNRIPTGTAHGARVLQGMVARTHPE